MNIISTDKEIVDLFLARNEEAIAISEQKYGTYCRAVSQRILSDAQDAEECVNDTLLQAWNSIPPARPKNMKAYLAKAVRNISLNRLKYNNRQKRAADEYAAAYEELENVISSGGSPEEQADVNALRDAINSFLGEQSVENRRVFVARYFYFEPVKNISNNLGISESKTKMILLRMRNSLKAYLEKEGVII